MQDDQTITRLRQAVRYDPETGVFTYTSGRGKGGAATKDGYLQLRLAGKVILAHRAAWALHFGYLPSLQIDHINGDRRDNRICNLREATAGQNSQNSTPQVGRASRFTGVVWHKRDKCWQAQIRLNGKLHYLGSFKLEEDAKAAYVKAKAELHSFQPAQRSMG